MLHVEIEEISIGYSVNSVALMTPVDAFTSTEFDDCPTFLNDSGTMDVEGCEQCIGLRGVLRAIQQIPCLTRDQILLPRKLRRHRFQGRCWPGIRYCY